MSGMIYVPPAAPPRIKSIQRGVITATPGNSLVTGTVTVAAVNVAKSFLSVSSAAGKAADAAVSFSPSCGATLQDATTISWAIGAAISTGAVSGRIYWELVEFYD